MNYSNNEIKNLYKQFFNIGQVGLLDKFAFSQETITKAKGCYLYTESGKEILDMTSGFGTQNLGYNNSEIIKKELILQKCLPFQGCFSMKILQNYLKNFHLCFLKI